MALPMSYAGQRMTLDEFFALTGDEFRRSELQEGVLVMSPSPRVAHQWAGFALARQLADQLPPGWRPILDLDVIVEKHEPATVRQPDVLVARFDNTALRLPASEVVLAVEMISPGSRKIDLRLKPYEYAEAGIAHYWVVDLDPPAPSITVFHLGAPGEGYVEAPPAVTGRLLTTEPFALDIDITALVVD
ncbi:Uma2 family endonuclease [Fodinicola feengrottensis]|uniref:Uma2 family endonuclease n=1 Tax=Fodinicola feengrottensis TaxID=435914 RepID=UPI00244328EE|nr:Uma2 family endonuclease [Fodinicola feengrottensis]